jgi:HSP20 family molecular chaperone IbpA
MAKKEDKRDEEIRKLKERIKKLEEEKPLNSKGEDEEESIAGGLLKGIGKVIPGLGGLLKGMEKSPAFKERLKRIDEEVERKLREQPLKRVGEREPRVSMGIPPGARGKTVRRRPSVRKRPTTVKPEGPPSAPEERPVDIFDEKGHIKIIGEIPGVEEKDIKVNLKNDIITIKVDVSNRKYHQDLKLPCKPKGKIEKSYKNGILEIKIMKNE